MSVNAVLLIDESAAMDGSLDKTSSKTKAESVATAVNALLNRLSGSPDLELALVGYRSDRDGNVEVGCRWQGDLAGREFVPTCELADTPVTTEQRVRKIPGTAGMMEEQTVDFPVWYRPELGEKAPQIAAFQYCRDLLERSAGLTGAPLVIHISAGPSGDGNPVKAVKELQELDLPGGVPLVMQVHLTSSFTLPPVVCPSNRAYLPLGPTRELFERASLLPAHLVQALEQAGLTINPKARGMIYNAQMADVSRLLSLIAEHARSLAPAPVEAAAGAEAAATVDVPPAEPITGYEQEPTPEPITGYGEEPIAGFGEEPVAGENRTSFQVAPGSVTPEQPALLVFVLDRSVEDPYSGNVHNPCSQMQDQMGDLIEQIVKVGMGSIDLGIVTYGVDDQGEADVRVGLEGALVLRSYARDNELVEGAIRVDSFTEELSDGVGGLIKISHERPVLVEVEPTSSALATPAFTEAAQMITTWCDENPGSLLPPVVLHLTRGRVEHDDAENAAAQLEMVTTPSGLPVTLYHLVATEDDHPRLQYPDDEGCTADPQLQDLWRLSSSLLCVEDLAEENAAVTSGSRGFVVNGKFNLLLDAIKRGLEE